MLVLVAVGLVLLWASCLMPTVNLIIADSVRAVVKAHDPNMVLMELRPMQELVERAQASTRFQLMLIGVFAAIAGALVLHERLTVFATVGCLLILAGAVMVDLAPAVHRGLLRVIRGEGKAPRV